MKKLPVFLLCLVLLAGCAAEAPVQQESQVTEAVTEESVPTESLLYAQEPEVIDLTAIQGEEVYHVINDLMRDPYDHLGCIVVATGTFTVFHTEGSPDYFPAVMIDDEDGCSAEGIEFVLADDPAFPDGYPQEGEMITVVGNLDLYRYDGVPRCHLVNATLR